MTSLNISNIMPKTVRVGSSVREKGKLVETTGNGKVRVQNGERFSGDLVSEEDLQSRTIAEVRWITECEYFGRNSHLGALADPFVFVFSDGGISRPFVLLEGLNFVEGPAESFIASGILSRERYEELCRKEQDEQERQAKIRELLAKRIEIQKGLDHRYSIRDYRGLVRQLRGIEDQLVALGHRFPNS